MTDTEFVTVPHLFTYAPSVAVPQASTKHDIQGAGVFITRFERRIWEGNIVVGWPQPFSKFKLFENLYQALEH